MGFGHVVLALHGAKPDPHNPYPCGCQNISCNFIKLSLRVRPYPKALHPHQIKTNYTIVAHNTLNAVSNVQPQDLKLSIEPRACTFIKIFGSGMVPTTFDRSWEDAPWFGMVDRHTYCRSSIPGFFRGLPVLVSCVEQKLPTLSIKSVSHKNVLKNIGARRNLMGNPFRCVYTNLIFVVSVFPALFQPGLGLRFRFRFHRSHVEEMH